MSKGIDRDCTDKCKSTIHGDTITSVITKRGVTDAELCSFIRWCCTNSGQINDATGRNAVHLAASCGRVKLLKWLLLTQHQLINTKDLESGYSALHRSIFYGQINVAVTLIQLGANVHSLDNNDLSPLDHAMKDASPIMRGSVCQAYVWGTNTNYTLGLGHQHAKQLPEIHDAFHKKYTNVSVLQMCMSKYHSVIVTREGRVFTCGHGQGGRLGLSTENTVLIPEEVEFLDKCIEASVGLDHSIFLSESGNVWTCGLNTHHVLGFGVGAGAGGKQLLPRMVPSLTDIKGVCAGRFHTVAWNSKGVYTWGLHAGQLGHDKAPTTSYASPKLVSNILSKDTEVVCVAASDGATVVTTKKGDVYVFHEYQTRKIASKYIPLQLIIRQKGVSAFYRILHEWHFNSNFNEEDWKFKMSHSLKQLNVVKVIVVGGTLNSKLSNDILVEKGGNELKVLVLHSTGNLYLWQESWPQLSRCIYSLNRPLIITDAALSRTQLFFVTVDGEAYRGEFKTRKKIPTTATTTEKKTTFHEFLDKNECQMIKVHRYPHVHRAVKICCDLKGRNFAVIQCAPQCLLIDVPEVSPKTIARDMFQLLNSSDEMDAIHDACFKVSGQIFAVHRYIIASKSEPLYNLIEANTNTNTIELTNIHPIIFKQILMYIYTGTCDLITCGPCTPEISQISNKSNKSNKKDVNPIGLVQQAAKRFAIKSLYKQLDNYMFDVNGGYIQLKSKQKFSDDKFDKFDRRMLKHLQDVVIQSKSGGEIHAHKCILAARLEYFNNLFALRWNESSNKKITLPITDNVMETVVDFLYTDEAPNLTDDVDHISNVLIVADQLFIERLKQISEVVLSGLLTLKNAAHMLQFSSIYNAKQLKRCCMEFICLNLAAVLESRILDLLQGDILQDLTDFYCNWNKALSCRVITPYSTAPSDESVKSVAEAYPVNLDELDEIVDVDEKKTPKSTKKRTRRTSDNCHIKTTSISESNELISEKIEIVQNTNKITEDDKKWIKILDDKEKHKKIVQNRLRAIANAKEEVVAERPKSNLVKLSSFEDNVYDIPIQMGQKLSQKQRKKLLVLDKPIEVEEKADKKTNPWQKNEIPSTSSNILEDNFLDIISDERKQKENWSKMRARPLIYSQMEDKAISDLERFYNIDNVTDECITIHKVEKGVFAVPLWVHNNKFIV